MNELVSVNDPLYDIIMKTDLAVKAVSLTELDRKVVVIVVSSLH